MPSFVSPAQAARIQQRFRDLEDTVKVVFWDVSWVAWTKDREDTGTDTWDNGGKAEDWERIGAGTGRLRANGSGGPVIGEAAIWQQAPYRLRTDVSAALTPRMWLVIDGTRLFKVEHFENRGGDRQHGYAYLTELFGWTLPPEPDPEPEP